MNPRSSVSFNKGTCFIVVTKTINPYKNAVYIYIYIRVYTKQTIRDSRAKLIMELLCSKKTQAINKKEYVIFSERNMLMHGYDDISFKY